MSDRALTEATEETRDALAALDAARRRVADLEARVAALTGALAWYAEPDNWCGVRWDATVSRIPADNDLGERARAALARGEGDDDGQARAAVRG